MLSRVFLNLAGSGTPEVPTNGGMAAEGASVDVQGQSLASPRERYAPGATAVPPGLPESVHDHLENLQDEESSGQPAPFRRMRSSPVSPMLRANEVPAITVEEVIVTSENVQQHAEEADDRLVRASQTQSRAIDELSSTVEKLTTDQNVEGAR